MSICHAFGPRYLKPRASRPGNHLLFKCHRYIDERGHGCQHPFRYCEGCFLGALCHFSREVTAGYPTPDASACLGPVDGWTSTYLYIVLRTTFTKTLFVLHTRTKENRMPKGQDAKKAQKKQPGKTLKEKRLAKKDKKAS